MDKPLNSTMEEDLRSYDAASYNPAGAAGFAANPSNAGLISSYPSGSIMGLGAHLSPNGGHQSFVDMHEVHYAGE